MTDLALFPELMPEEQFRAVRLQVHNWGTFSGCNDIPIAEEGFLFVGASGSGKSTLLDAFLPAADSAPLGGLQRCRA